MPKLPLDPDRLRALSASLMARARDAARHPRRTVTQAVSGTVEIVGAVTRRGSALTTPTAPPSAEAPAPAAPPVTVTEESPAPEAPSADDVPEAEVEAEVEPEVNAELGAPPADAPEEHLSGPAPHMPAGLAKDIERDFDEDIPGISGRRDR